MLSGMGVAIRVITAPNSAFAHIRDGDGGYLGWSVGIFVFSSVLWSFLAAPLDTDYEYWGALAVNLGMSLLVNLVFAAVIHLVGRRLGGNNMWRTVFSAVFYTNVIALVFALFAVLVLLAGGVSLWALLTNADSSGPYPWPTGDLFELLGYLAVLVAGIIAFVVWVAVVLVKAVKTVNGFGTAKAFGLVVLAMAVALAVSSIATAPFNL